MPSRIPCELCQKDLFLKYRMLCKKCPRFYLCLNCFFEKSEVPPHESSHSMLLYPGGLPKKNTNEPPSSENAVPQSIWALDEDHYLIEGVKRLGFGNWSEIASLLKTKTAVECKQRYFTRYNIKGTNNLKPNSELKKENEEFIKHLPKRLYDKRNDFGFLPYRLEFSSEVKNDTEFLLVDMGVIEHLNPVLNPKLPTENNIQDQKSAAEILHEINRVSPKPGKGRKRAGNGPKFDKSVVYTDGEIKEHQKNLVSQIKANNIDILNIYNDVVCERHDQKNFVFNSDLFWNTTHKRKRKDKDITNLLKPFRKLVKTDEEFEGIVESYTRQREFGETIADSVISGMSALSILGPNNNNKEVLKEIEKMIGIPQRELEQLQSKIGSLVRQGIKKTNGPEKFGHRKNFELKQENGKYVVEIKNNAAD